MNLDELRVEERRLVKKSAKQRGEISAMIKDYAELMQQLGACRFAIIREIRERALNDRKL